MAKKKDSIDRIEQKLIAAHRGRPEAELTPQWRKDLMSDIRLTAAGAWAGAPRPDDTEIFTGLLFRFAGAGALVAALLIIYLYGFVPGIEAEFAGLLFNEPLGWLPLDHLFLS